MLRERSRFKFYAPLEGFGPHETEPGIVEIGGFGGAPIDLWRDYILASRLLLEAGQVAETPMPIAYCQRHSVELAIKNLTSLAFEISDFEKRKGTGMTSEGRSPTKSHKFDVLLEELAAALSSIHEEFSAGDFHHVASVLAEVEQGFPDRWRYLMIGIGHRTAQMPSFEEPVVLDLKRRQEAIEELFEKHMVWRGYEATKLGEDARTLLERLTIRWDVAIKACFDNAEVSVEPFSPGEVPPKP